MVGTGAGLAARRKLSTDPAALQQRHRAILREKQRVEAKLRAVKARQKEARREYRAARVALAETEARLGETREGVQEARLNLAQAQREWRAAQGRLEDHRENVSERLVAVYELGEARPVEVLLQSTSFADFLNRLYLLNQVVERDAELLDQFEQAEAAADQHRANMATEQRRLSELESRWEARREKVSDWRDQAAQKAARFLLERAEYERQLVELEQNSREVTALLQRVERTRAGRARLATPWTGSLLRPVGGRVTSGFGYRTHPIFRVRKMHTGVDIAAPHGTPIRAAAGGVVLFAGRWGGYGNCVILDHGGGLATLYAHCSSLAVGEGETVQQGQTIARVGSTGLSTGPHLHFETRRNGEPVSPAGL